MKKHIIKVVALLLFTSVAMSSCVVGYRERGMHRHDSDRHNRYDNRYDNRNDHRYDNDNYHHY
jgi:ABC-type nickel/cobalt efflux system permease component RcnA